MTAYQQAGDAAKMVDAAKQLLQVNPNNVRALALLSYIARMSAGQPGGLQQSVADARAYGEKGLQALKVMPCPEGASPADVEKLQKQTSVIFHGAVGFAALQSKDYPAAQQHFQEAVNAEPPTAQDSLQDVYSLALAYLEPKPLNPAGLWYIARAVVLSNNNAQIANYGKAKYIKYHGGDDGWDQVLAEAKAAAGNAPPQSFAVAPAPSPAEQAAKLASTVDPKKMDFGQWELVLSAGDPATQQKVWSQIKGIEVPFAALVIESTKTKLSLAATADAIEQKKADVTVTMTGPIPATMMSKVAPGQEVQVIARPDSYTPNPFMMQMNEGQLIAKKEPPKKPSPAHRRTTH
jgi:tetratricopeptide (TPR) repeat protein